MLLNSSYLCRMFFLFNSLNDLHDKDFMKTLMKPDLNYKTINI